MESDISKQRFPRQFIQFMVRLPKLMEHFFGFLFLSGQNGKYACSFKAAYTSCWIIVPKVLLTTLNFFKALSYIFGMVNSTLVCWQWHKRVKNC